MLDLIYVSTAVRAFSDADLVALLKQSREKNTRLVLTGMLLYKDLSFIQLLGGPDEAVRGILATISRDNRHTGILVLLDRQIEHRRCPDWSMGFQNLNDPELQSLPGYSEFMNESLDSERFQTDPSHAIRLLELFRQNMTRWPICRLDATAREFSAIACPAPRHQTHTRHKPDVDPVLTPSRRGMTCEVGQ